MFPVLANLNKPTTNASGAFNNWGTSVTSGAANTAGSWISLGVTPAWPSYLIRVVINSVAVATFAQNAYFDIGIGPNDSSVTTIIEGLSGAAASPMYDTSTAGGGNGGRQYEIPILIPPNTELWARHQNVVATSGGYVQVSYQGGGIGIGNAPYCSKVVALGANAGTTLGTSITPGISGAEGNWTQIVASTAQDYMGFLVGAFCNDGTQGVRFMTYDLAIGASSSEISIAENCGMVWHNGNEMTHSISYPVLARVPAGSRLSLRVSNHSGTNDTAHSAIINAMVA